MQPGVRKHGYIFPNHSVPTSTRTRKGESASESAGFTSPTTPRTYGGV